MLLSHTFMKDIVKSLNKGNFLYQDFSVKDEKYTNYILLTIQYSYLPEYKLRGYIDTSGDSYRVEFTPGAVTTTEKRNNLKRNNFLAVIDTWLYNITNELEANPYARELNRQKEILKEFNSRINDLENQDDPFTQKERDDVEDRLDKLEKMFSEKLESDSQSESDLNEELQKLHQEIETLKLHLNAFTKKNWYLSFTTRLYRWYTDNPIIVRQLAGLSKELLPNEVQDVITNETLDQLLLPPSDSEK